MAVSNIKALITGELQKVWELVLDIENYGAWRSDLSKTEVGLDRRTGKWYAYINFQKKHYNLGLHKDKSAAIRARRAAEARLHDPVILEYWDSLTEKRKKEFQDYLRSTNK